MSAKPAASIPSDPSSSANNAAPHHSGTLATPAEPLRRAHARQDIELEVTLESESNFYMGLTENLSMGGLFIATHALRPLGSSLDVAFKLPGDAEPVRLAGTVRWVREYSETSDSGPGLGVRFDDITPETADRIRAFLTSRDPLFFDED